MISCIIIDNEQHSIDVVRSYCKKFPYLKIVGEFTLPEEAHTFIDFHQGPIDLVFLDIKMTQFSGVDFLKAYSFPNVIIVTADADFALDSYRYGVVDYLLKQFSFDRFSDAIAKVYHRHQNFENTATNKLQMDNKDVLYLKIERNKYVKLEYETIKYMEGAGNYTVIHTILPSDKIVTSKRLKELEEQLSSRRFKRVHKSHLINMDYFETLDGNMITLKSNNEKLTLGESYRKYFMDFINGLC